MNKSRRLGLAGHVAMEEARSALRILTGKPIRKDRLIGLVVSMSDY